MNRYFDFNNIDEILEPKFRGDDFDSYTYKKNNDGDEFDWQLYQYLVGKMND